MRDRPLILIVDDQEEFREIISTKVHAAGFDFITAKSGEEAIQKAPELLPDLILMDINMRPGETGVEAAISIRENPKTKAIKVAFLTNQNDPWPGMTGGNEVVSKELGMQGFFDKADIDGMVKKLKEIFFVPSPGAS